METTQALTLVNMFQYQGNSLRHVLIDSEPWWLAIDVCEILGIVNNRQAVENLQESEKLTYPVHTSGQLRNAWLVNEPGLYRLIFQSRKPEAEAIKYWVYHEVLPTIRKTGSYSLQGLDSLAYLDQIIEKQREILRGYRKVKHQEQKRLGMVTPRQPRGERPQKPVEQAVLETIQRLHVRNICPSIADLRNYLKMYDATMLQKACSELVQAGKLRCLYTSHTNKYTIEG